MISQQLEASLHKQFVEARSKRHEYITVEHLLLGLLEEPSAAGALCECGTDLDKLRTALNEHIQQQTPLVAAERQLNTQPTLGFQRVLQRAILHAQSAGKKEVSGADVLVAIFAEKNSHAVYFLNKQGVDRLQILQSLPRDSSAAEALESGDYDLDAEGLRQIILFREQETSAEITTRVLEDFLLMQGEELGEVLGELNSSGKALCGLYPRQTAEFIVGQVKAYAAKHGLPLRCEATIQARRPPRSAAHTQQK